MPEEAVQEWEAKDPIMLLRSRLIDSGLPESEIETINTKVESSIKDAVRFAKESPQPSIEEFLEEIKLQ
jgi:pyruvate dehydrogenase E1 component alpha subunit